MLNYILLNKKINKVYFIKIFNISFNIIKALKLNKNIYNNNEFFKVINNNFIIKYN